MKNAFILFMFILALTFCKKDEETTYEKSQLIGTWTQVKPTDDAGSKLKFTNDSIIFIDTDNGVSYEMGTKYTFDGKSIKFNLLVDVTMKVQELTSSKFVASSEAGGATETVEYKK